MNAHAVARNFFFAKVFFSSPSSRQENFQRVKEMTKNEKFMNDFVAKNCGACPPFNQLRYDFVKAEGKRIASDPQLMKNLLKKTRFCTNADCSGNEKCSFAHTIEEYNTPTCLHKEFCLDISCKKNHGFTKEEYLSYYDISVPEKKEVINLDKTQLCVFMKENRPCYIEDCKFAHSLWELRPMECKVRCKGETCKLLHKGENLFEYLENQSIKIKPWMLRSTELNTIEEFFRLRKILMAEQEENEKKWFEEQDKFIETFRVLERNGWRDELEEVFESFRKMDLYDEEEEEEEEDIIVTFCGKTSITLNECMEYELVY